MSIFQKQATYDISRKIYSVVVPNVTRDKQLQAFLRAIGGNLKNGIGRLTGVPSVVFELHGRDHGIHHVMRLPSGARTESVISQLRAHIPGAFVKPIKDYKPITYDYGVDVSMSNTTRTLRIESVTDLSTSVLASVQALKEGEHVTLQYVLTHSEFTKSPPMNGNVQSSQFSILRALTGNTMAGSDERADRRAKSSEQNFKAAIRVGAKAETVERAKELVSRVTSALSAENDKKAFFIDKPRPIDQFNSDIALASTPLHLRAQFSITELSGLLGFPMGEPHVSGLPMGLAPQLPASQSIVSDGLLVLGESTFPGGERPLALTPNQATRHIYIPGVSGVGKTTLMLNLASKIMNAGHGLIIFDAKKDIADGVLNRVPEHRVDDVIYIDFLDTSRPIGMNPLDQGRSSAAVDEIAALLQHVYPEIGRGVYARQLLHYGLHALDEAHGDYNMLDLLTLLNPKTPEQKRWQAAIIGGLKDRATISFFKDWAALKEVDRLRHLEPLDNKYWQFDRPEIRNVLGQTKSAFQMKDVILGNKILIVKMVGMPSESMKLAAVSFMDGLWGAVRDHTPEKENFLILDEFADFTNLPVDFEAMLAKARSANMCMVLANQEFGQLSVETRSALMANASTKLAFKLSMKDARLLADEFSSNAVTPSDFVNLPAYHAIARIYTDAGIAPPASLITKEAPPQTGMAFRVMQESRAKYGRPVAEVEQERDERCTLKDKPRSRPPVGWA